MKTKTILEKETDKHRVTIEVHFEDGQNLTWGRQKIKKGYYLLVKPVPLQARVSFFPSKRILIQSTERFSKMIWDAFSLYSLRPLIQEVSGSLNISI